MMPVVAEKPMPSRASATAPSDIATIRPVAYPASRRRPFWREEWFLFLLFVAPNFILFGIFSYWPMISNVYLSLVRWDMIAPVKTFVGAANYRYLFDDDTFRTVLRNSLVFTIGAVGGSLMLGLATALCSTRSCAGATARGRSSSRRRCSAARPSASSGSTSSIPASACWPASSAASASARRTG